MQAGPQAFAAEIERRVRALATRDVATVRALRREVSREIRDRSARGVLALAKVLLAGPTERFVAYELVQHHPAAAAALGARELERLGKGMSSWGEVDCFAVYLAGPSWRAGQVGDVLIRRWASSKDRWWRRAALVSTVPLNMRSRGGQGDARGTLTICRLLLDDRDDMVVKAHSWALRELAKRDPASVRRFLARYEARLAPRVLREVRNKLRTGLKSG